MEGNFNTGLLFVFTIGCLGLVPIYFGYKLFILGIFPKEKDELYIEMWKTTKIYLKRASPGTICVVAGALISIFGVTRDIGTSRKENDKTGTVEYTTKVSDAKKVFDDIFRNNVAAIRVNQDPKSAFELAMKTHSARKMSPFVTTVGYAKAAPPYLPEGVPMQKVTRSLEKAISNNPKVSLNEEDRKILSKILENYNRYTAQIGIASRIREVFTTGKENLRDRNTD